MMNDSNCGSQFHKAHSCCNASTVNIKACSDSIAQNDTVNGSELRIKYHLTQVLTIPTPSKHTTPLIC